MPGGKLYGNRDGSQNDPSRVEKDIDIVRCLYQASSYVHLRTNEYEFVNINHR